MYEIGARRKTNYKSMASTNAQNIQVAVRVRPLNERERNLNSHSIIECNEKTKEINAINKSGAMTLDKKYTFDKVFGVTSKQSEVYNQLVKPVVLEVIEGYNCTIFAYGQTGTGKTHTMEGSWTSVDDLAQSWDTDQMVGVIPRSVAHLFTCLNSISSCEYSVKISFIELYNEELSDLLTVTNENDKLKIFDDPANKGSVKIPGLEEVVVKNKSEVYKLLQRGSNRRQQAATLMNSQSSRSHSVFTITVYISEKSIEGEKTIKVGKLNLVDLAGSENIERSGATGKRAAEAGKINKSLTTLGRVITALVEHGNHIPYRESNLTRLLQDSLGGRTKTTLIATVSPAVCNLEETLSTLDYAYKAKSIKNKPEVNQKLVKKALLKDFTEEIENLKRELYSTREKNGIYLPQDMYDELKAKLANQKDEIREHIVKNSSLSDDLEKLDEVYTDTKQSLAERNVQLKNKTEKLEDTELHLEKVKVECDETKYLLDVQISTEKNLYSDAKFLKGLTIEQNEDCERLHDKIGRVMTVAESNKELTAQFAERMCQKMSEMQGYYLEVSVEQTNSLCSVCEALGQVKERLEDMKTENVCQLNIFEEKQQNWLELRQKFVDNELKKGFHHFYEAFLQEVASGRQINEQNYKSQLKLCTDHTLLFTHTYEELTENIQTTVQHNMQFKQSFENGAQVLMAKQEANTKADSEILVKEVKNLAKSFGQTKQELNELKEFKSNFQSTLQDSMKGFEQQMKNFQDKMGQLISSNFKEMDTKMSRITGQNEQDMIDLNKLKNLAKEQVDTRLAAGIQDFTELVVVPVVELLEVNNQNLTELNTLTNTLNDNYQLSLGHLHTSFDTSTHTQQSNISSLCKLAEQQSGAMDRKCVDLNEQMTTFSRESEGFFTNFIANSVEAELGDVLETVNEANHEIRITNRSIGKRSEHTQKFCEQSMSLVDVFAYGEFRNVVASGQTPMPREFDPPGELPRTKDHRELIEGYRTKLQELDLLTPLKISPTNSNDCLKKASSDTNSPHLVEPKVETSKGLKRVATDKENLSDKANKQSKLVGRVVSKFKQPVFGANN